MKPLFTARGRQALLEHLSEPCLFIFDFDGVLAPLLAQRHKVRTRRATAALVRKLQKLAPVAVVTGRSIADAGPKLKFTPSHFAGNHGAEGIRGLWKNVGQVKKAVAGWNKALQPTIESVPGLDLENKKLSLSVHYRHCRDPKEGLAALLKAAKKLHPKPRLIHGKMVVNFVWPKAPNKGTAIAALMKRTGYKRFFFMGDDYTDEDGFKLRKPSLFTVRVGYRKGSAARYYIPDQKSVDGLLKYFISIVGQR